MSQKIFCDRCHKEIKPEVDMYSSGEAVLTRYEIKITRIAEPRLPVVHESKYDVCDACLARVHCAIMDELTNRPGQETMKEIPALYHVARKICHDHGMSWQDPRSGVTYPPPKKSKRKKP